MRARTSLYDRNPHAASDRNGRGDRSALVSPVLPDEPVPGAGSEVTQMFSSSVSTWQPTSLFNLHQRLWFCSKARCATLGFSPKWQAMPLRWQLLFGKLENQRALLGKRLDTSRCDCYRNRCPHLRLAERSVARFGHQIRKALTA